MNAPLNRSKYGKSFDENYDRIFNPETLCIKCQKHKRNLEFPCVDLHLCADCLEKQVGTYDPPESEDRNE